MAATPRFHRSVSSLDRSDRVVICGAGPAGLTAAYLLAEQEFLEVPLRPHPVEETFEHWVSNRFGARLYEIFFKTYTEKVWGIPCTETPQSRQ